MTKAMPFLQKAILLSYDPRPFGEGFSVIRYRLIKFCGFPCWKERIFSSTICIHLLLA